MYTLKGNKTMKIQALIALLFLGVGMFFNQPSAAEDSIESPLSEETMETKKLLSPLLAVVKFHADWCPESRALKNIIPNLQNRFDGRPVLFLKFDRTNISTRNKAELLATALQLEEIYKKYQGTGFIVLIEWKTKKDLKTLTPDNSMDVIVQSITNAMTN